MIDNAIKSPDETIRSELKALAEGVPFSWGRISRLANLVDRSGFWRGDYNSFTEWLDSHADQLRVKRSMLWRYITAGRFYTRHLRSGFPDLAAKPLEDISDEISPENLELLSKTFRAAPENVYKALAVKLLSGEAKRSELRAAWISFRPVLDGKTARGRGTPPPKIEFDINRTDEKQIAALMRHQLSNSDASWTGLKNLTLCKVFTEVKLASNLFLDLVVVTRGNNSVLMMHGIEIKTQLMPATTRAVDQLVNISEQCDYLWLAIPDTLIPEALQEAIKKFPENIGFLTVGPAGIKTIRQPRWKERPTKTERLARELLELSIRR